MGAERNLKWDRRFLELAGLLASWSKDPSTKVGCVIIGPSREIVSTGYNGLPRGVNDSEERLNCRELKYQLTVHAEQNAILHAARIGVPLLGCSAYATWPPCTRCAVSWVQAGIARVVWPQLELPDRWRQDFELAASILSEAGVEAGAVVAELGEGADQSVDHDEALQLLHDLANAIRRKRFQGQKSVQVAVLPGCAVNGGQQYKIAVHLPSGAAADPSYTCVLFRAYLPFEGYPVTVDMFGEEERSCADKATLEATLKEILRHPDFKQRLTSLDLMAKQRQR